MGIETVTTTTCDWCEKKLGSDEKVGEGDWSWAKECSWSQRQMVACSDKCRGRIDALWEVFRRGDVRTSKGGRPGRILVFCPRGTSTPPAGVDKDEGDLVFQFLLDNFTIAIKGFRDFEITGHIERADRLP